MTNKAVFQDKSIEVAANQEEKQILSSQVPVRAFVVVYIQDLSV